MLVGVVLTYGRRGSSEQNRWMHHAPPPLSARHVPAYPSCEQQTAYTCDWAQCMLRQICYSRLLMKTMKRDSPTALTRSAYFSPNTVPASRDASCRTACFTGHVKGLKWQGSCSMSKLWTMNARTSSSRFLIDVSRAQDAMRAPTWPARTSGEAPVLSYLKVPTCRQQ